MEEAFIHRFGGTQKRNKAVERSTILVPYVDFRTKGAAEQILFSLDTERVALHVNSGELSIWDLGSKKFLKQPLFVVRGLSLDRALAKDFSVFVEWKITEIALKFLDQPSRDSIIVRVKERFSDPWISKDGERLYGTEQKLNSPSRTLIHSISPSNGRSLRD